MIRVLRYIATLTLAWGLASASYANMLPEPSGPVILSVSGKIENRNGGDTADFDRDMLTNLDWRVIESYTRWTDGATEFAGVPLTKLLDAVGANGAKILASALNDYTVEIPFSDARDHDVLLAMEINGKAMRIRDKGPIWIIYPQDEEHSKTSEFDDMMIWQLRSIKITD